MGERTTKASLGIGWPVGIMILRKAGTLVYLPLILPLFLLSVIVGSLAVARPLLLLMLLPLAIGIVLKAYRENLAALIKPLPDAISNISLVPILALILLLNIDKVLHIFGSDGMMGAVLLTILVSSRVSTISGAFQMMEC